MKEDSDVVDPAGPMQVVAMKKIIAICQSKGEFFTNKDGTLSYSGGDAYAMDLNEQTTFDYFKKEVAEMFGCNADTMIIKYFLPSNKKTPITISKDKDLQRMISFVGDSESVDVFILPEDVNARIVSNNMPASRSSRTTESEIGPLMEVEPVNMVYDTVEVHTELPLSTVPMSMAMTITPSDESHRRAAIQWENMITGVDQRFSSFSEFKEALHKYSIAHGFAYRYKKNDSHRVSVKCKGQGCPWRIYASRLSTTQLVAIKKMNPTHTCDGANVKAGYRATRGWVGSIIKDKLKESPHYRPKDIAEDIRKEYGIQLNYSQAWRAKEIAREQLQGSYKEAYKLLPLFCEKIKETNPGSFATFYTKEDSSFHRLFVSFHASISGFQQGCRPLLFLDNVPLLSKYPGVLLAVISADGDDGIFPLAFAVVDAETEENWYWFLQELRMAIAPNPEQQMTFVADFQNGLKNSIAEVFPNAFHAYCLRSLAEKLNKDLKGQFSHEARRFMMNDLYEAAYATKVEGFQNAVNSIKSISPEACNWVLQSEPEHWANAFFPGARYNHMLSNFGQDFYGWVAEAQELPITQLIDGLRGKLMESMYTRRVESSQWVTRLTPSKEEKLQKEALVSQTLHVQIADSNKFDVHGESVLEVVDLENPECTCKDWTITGMPCAHAVAVIEGISSEMIDSRGIYEYCSRYFTTEMYQITYGESINPIPNVEVTEGNGSMELAVMVTPPPTRRPPGRPKLKPSDPVDMIKRQLQCSKCKGLGHNKKTCKAA